MTVATKPLDEQEQERPTNFEEERLTKYSEHGGCGCKISPHRLREILGPIDQPRFVGENLKVLVDGTTKDDAAVIALTDTEALVATTDFFTPIVDNAFDYGRIAACNAISDVYAMGGRPLTALSILAWPDFLNATLASEVLRGANAICDEAGITITGGHSIINSVPIFGLAVNGIVQIKNIKRNGMGAPSGSILSLTKPLGVGIYCAAKKKGLLSDEDWSEALGVMTRLNKEGVQLGYDSRVTLMTDVTGFGLYGHLKEVSEASNREVELDLEKIPLLSRVRELIRDHGIETGAGKRNRLHVEDSSWLKLTGTELDVMHVVLHDPQTSGGLLIGSESSLGDTAAMIGRLK